MKLVYSLNLSFLLFVFITYLSLVFSSDDVEQVLDIAGDPVIAGNKYHIIPSISSRFRTGGGLKLAKTSSNTNCEVTILQSDHRFASGTTVKFTNLDNSTEKILTSKPIEIEITEKPDCAQSSKWIVFVDYNIKKACVGIGGDKNYHDLLTLPGTFDILKRGTGYQFGFCNSGVCSNIRSYERVREGGKRLFLSKDESEDPYEFIFLPNFFETGTIKSVA